METFLGVDKQGAQQKALSMLQKTGAENRLDLRVNSILIS
jgi:hypothetical protein